MKKIILFIMVAVLLMGCSGSAYETYSRALEKTESVSSGRGKITQEFYVDLNTEGLEPEVVRELNKWKEFKVDIEFTLDKDQEKGRIDIYSEFYELGVEGKIYEDGEDLYLVTPLLPKILLLKDENFEATENVYIGGAQFSIQDFKNMGQLWKDTMDQEKVSTLGNIVISTPEGDIKAKEFEITLTNEDVIPLIAEGTKLLTQVMVEQMKSSDTSIDMVKIEEEFKKAMEEIDFDKIYHRAYIDRDGFVVEEETHIIMQFPIVEGRHIRTIEIKGKEQNWDLGKKVDITMPNLTKENTMTIEELKEMDVEGLIKGGR